MKHYAGLDLSMESTQVCIVDDNGRKVVSEKVESSPEAIAMMLERYGPLERAVIETGRMSPAICLGLRELGVPVVCIDARQAHQSLKAMKANKTDPHDAAGLAQLARTGFYKEVHVKSPAAHGVRSVITARSHLVEARVRLDNTIRGLCATFGYRPGAGQGRAFLERIMQAAHIPGLGWPLNILPLLMGISMILQMKLTPQPATADKTQATMMKFMPLIFLWISYNFASALALYWTAQNLFNIMQARITRFYQKDPVLEKVERPAAGAGGAAALNANQKAKKDKPSPPRPGGGGTKSRGN